MTTETKISLRENGPLVVSAPPLLRDTDGAEVETKPVIALCRCGRSANKPFCDGAHSAEPAFKSAPDHTKLRNAAVDYTGTVDGVEVTISYTPVLCSHAAECVSRANAVFDPERKPWIVTENGTMSQILDVMAACPSGALRVRLADMTAQHMTTGEASIEVERNGPYRVKNVPIEAEFNGVGASRAKYVLCRCGHSNNKPFCDGSHRDAGWTDDQ
ncbi:MAG: CDGSH iron-sulfur domain-containing protein [Pseudomonadota bacterium]